MINLLVALANPIGKCRLSRLKGGAKLRSAIVEGDLIMVPTVGAPFFMRGAPLETDEGCRIVNTSPLVEILSTEADGEFILKTKSGSEYLLEIDRESSNGRTLVFETSDPGSNPGSRTGE